jgi:hypothetical protein
MPPHCLLPPPCPDTNIKHLNHRYLRNAVLVNLVSGAKKSIILIDNYVDLGTLNILTKKNKAVNVCIYTHRDTQLTVLDVSNFNKQYPKLEVSYTEKFHDRSLLLDECKLYHIGASLKDAGKKCFAINLMADNIIVKEILSRLNGIDGFLKM